MKVSFKEISCSRTLQSPKYPYTIKLDNTNDIIKRLFLIYFNYKEEGHILDIKSTVNTKYLR